MGKKKHAHEEKESKKVIIVFVVVGIFLLGILVFQGVKGFQRFAVRRCVTRLVVVQEAMRTMKAEYAFKFNPDTQSSKYILDSLVLYFKYGEDAFHTNEQGYLVHKPISELRSLPEARRGDSYFPDYPECPDGYNYQLEPVEASPYFNLTCPRHGTLSQPDDKGRYVFDGAFSRLSPVEAEIGWEARLMIPSPYDIGKEMVILAPKPKSDSVN